MAYLAILRRPGMFPLLVSTFIARLPTGLNGIAVVLYVQAEQNSFAVAGGVVAAMAVGNAIGGPLQGRLIDRSGPWPLLGFAFAHAAGLLAIVFACGGGLPVPGQVFAGLFTGAAMPVTTTVLRSRWSYILADAPRLLTPAFALDSVLVEAAFITGPLIAGLALVLAGPIAAIVLSGCFAVLGTSAFTVLLAKQAGPGQRDERHRSLLGALSSGGIRLLTVISFPLGFYLGVVEIALPAFAHDIGHTALSGVFLAGFAAASTAAALVYGVYEPRRSLWNLHMRFTVLLPLAALPMVIAPDALLAALCIAFAGLPVAPVIASRNELVRHVAPVGTEAEAFAWPLTAMIVGLSAGAAIGGALIGPLGWRAPIIAGVMVAAAAAAPLLFLRPSTELLGQGVQAISKDAA